MYQTYHSVCLDLDAWRRSAINPGYPNDSLSYSTGLPGTFPSKECFRYMNSTTEGDSIAMSFNFSLNSFFWLRVWNFYIFTALYSSISRWTISSSSLFKIEKGSLVCIYPDNTDFFNPREKTSGNPGGIKPHKWDMCFILYNIINKFYKQCNLILFKCIYWI